MFTKIKKTQRTAVLILIVTMLFQLVGPCLGMTTVTKANEKTSTINLLNSDGSWNGDAGVQAGKTATLSPISENHITLSKAELTAASISDITTLNGNAVTSPTAEITYNINLALSEAENSFSKSVRDACGDDYIDTYSSVATDIQNATTEAEMRTAYARLSSMVPSDTPQVSFTMNFDELSAGDIASGSLEADVSNKNNLKLAVGTFTIQNSTVTVTLDKAVYLMHDVTAGGSFKLQSTYTGTRNTVPYMYMSTENSVNRSLKTRSL